MLPLKNLACKELREGILLICYRCGSRCMAIGLEKISHHLPLFTLFCIVLHYITLHRILSCHVMSCHVMSCHVMSYHIISYIFVLHYIILYISLYCTTLHYTTLCYASLHYTSSPYTTVVIWWNWIKHALNWGYLIMICHILFEFYNLWHVFFFFFFFTDIH